MTSIEEIKQQFESAYKSLMQRIWDVRDTQQQVIEDRRLCRMGTKLWLDHSHTITALDEHLRYLQNEANELQSDYNWALIKATNSLRKA